VQLALRRRGPFEHEQVLAGIQTDHQLADLAEQLLRGNPGMPTLRTIDSPPRVQEVARRNNTRPNSRPQLVQRRRRPWNASSLVTQLFDILSTTNA
jgi:hypothetical protein